DKLSSIIINGDKTVEEYVSEYFGITDMSATEKTKLQQAREAKDVAAIKLLLAQLIMPRAYITFAHHHHTGADVNLYAYIPEGVNFSPGNYDNVEITQKIVEFLGLDMKEATRRLQENFSYISKGQPVVTKCEYHN